MSTRAAGLVVALCLVWTACTPGDDSVSGDVRTVSDVTLNLRVEPARTQLGRSVRFTLTVTNNSGRPRTLRFEPGHRYDFWVTRGGREVWRWSGSQAPSPAETIVVEGQAATQFTESWTPSAEGRFLVHGEVSARSYEGELSAELVVQDS